MNRKYIASAIALGLLFGAAACSSDSEGGDLTSQIQEGASAEGEEVSDEEATCLGDVLVALLGADGAEEAVAGGQAGIQEAMTAISGGGDDPEGTLESLKAVDSTCLDLMGIDPASLEVGSGAG